MSFVHFCAIAERGADSIWILIFTLFCGWKHVFTQDNIKGRLLCVPVLCLRRASAHQTGEEGNKEGKAKKSCSLFPWLLYIGSLMSLTSHVRDGKAFLRQVLDSRWVKRGLGRSQWSRPILTRRHIGAWATKRSSDFQFLFSSHMLHLTGYSPREAEPSWDGIRAAWVSQSHLASVVLKIKRPYR